MPPPTRHLLSTAASSDTKFMRNLWQRHSKPHHSGVGKEGGRIRAMNRLQVSVRRVNWHGNTHFCVTSKVIVQPTVIRLIHHRLAFEKVLSLEIIFEIVDNPARISHQHKRSRHLNLVRAQYHFVVIL